MPRKAGWLSEGAPVYAVDASYPLDIASSFILLIKIPDLLIFSVFLGFYLHSINFSSPSTEYNLSDDK